MSQNLITTILSQEELSLKPGSSAVSFDVTVIKVMGLPPFNWT
jgi:hypothetical protein